MPSYGSNDGYGPQKLGDRPSTRLTEVGAKQQDSSRMAALLAEEDIKPMAKSMAGKIDKDNAATAATEKKKSMMKQANAEQAVTKGQERTTTEEAKAQAAAVNAAVSSLDSTEAAYPSRIAHLTPDALRRRSRGV